MTYRDQHRLEQELPCPPPQTVSNHATVILFAPSSNMPSRIFAPKLPLSVPNLDLLKPNSINPFATGDQIQTQKYIVDVFVSIVYYLSTARRCNSRKKHVPLNLDRKWSAYHTILYFLCSL